MLRFFLYQDAAKEWRWRLMAHNGRVIADGGEGYSTKGNAKAALTRLRAAWGSQPAPPIVWSESITPAETNRAASVN